ncbi:Diguanylate cyclase [Pseudomonas marincola]|uniref:Diguanylate cyclase n=2 Tax=Pseudomonas marincola TaxID=437900 RepID=A0A653EA09_9PSED|nr:EAL domain-containing protein [Pseudomonas marincola]CAE6916263.1 Diguanylate cyclase [Pseudomonas marincola]
MPSNPLSLDDTQPNHSSVALIRTSLFKFVCLLVGLFMLTGGLLAYIAHTLDAREIKEGQFHTANALKSLESSMDSYIRDNASWGDAYEHLHLQVDTDWAYVKQNLGASLYSDFFINGVFVIDPQGRTVYSVINGKLAQINAEKWLQQPALPLVEQARARAEAEIPVATYTQVAGTPAYVTAMAITTGDDPTIKNDGRSPSVMVLATLLNNSRLKALGQDYGVNDLRLASTSQAVGSNVMALGEDGNAGKIQWNPEVPSQGILIIGIPLIGCAALVVCLMAWVILRRTTVAAKALDNSYESLKHSEAALNTSEKRFRDVVEASSDWVWEINRDMRFTFLSERFESVTGLPVASWIGRSMDSLLYRQAGSMSDYLNNPDRDPHPSIQCHYRDTQGQERITRLSARAMVDGGFRGTATDVTEEEEARRRIEFLSLHDALTGLANRTRLLAFLGEKLKSKRSMEQPLLVLSVDLDRFKPVNDLLGHAAGDLVLNEISSRLINCIRHGDLVSRVGGDEFVLVLEGINNEEAVEEVCRRLIMAIEQPIKMAEQGVFVGASVGIAMAPNDADNVTEILRYSDIALYEAKAAGRNTWRFYASDMNDKIIERRRMESDLRYAINHDELRLHFQPRYRISDGQMVGAEALVRWQHPTRGLIAPDTFIPIAEDTGLIVHLGNWVLENACINAARWPDNLFVSVNLSPSEFKRGNLAERVKNSLISSGIDPARLELEITENATLDDAVGTLEVMNELKNLGVRITMDDFGTGYSSLNNLRTFPFDGLKIDRGFLNRLVDSEEDKSIIQAMISLGRALSLTVTAEGIETTEQLSWLETVDCHEGQGYFLSRPLDAKVFNAMLE